MDETDLLFTNEYIPTQHFSELPPGFNDEFKNYYESRMKEQKVDNIIEDVEQLDRRVLDEEQDENRILASFVPGNSSIGGIQANSMSRGKREKKTYISIDSRDRNKTLFSKPNHFRTFLGRTFYNVKSVKLASLEFPNTNAVINSSNNKIYWRNLEDIENDVIDQKTKTYPVYEATIRTGSYILTTLQTEIIHRLQSIKRQNNLSSFHFADVSLNYDTDLCTFRFLDLELLDPNPLFTTVSSNTINVKYNNHPFQVGDIVYIRDAKSLSDIPGNEINNEFSIISKTDNQFSVEVSTRASATTPTELGGGGQAVKVGKAAPFQFMFGNFADTIADNLGFPLRNSAQSIDTQIIGIQQCFLAIVTTNTPHNLRNTSEFVGKRFEINGTDVIDGNNTLAKVLDDVTLLFIPSSFSQPLPADKEFIDNRNNALTIKVRQNPNEFVVISSLRNNATPTVLIKTLTNHGFELDSQIIPVFDTDSKPVLDGIQSVVGVIDSTRILVEGRLEINGGAGDVSGNKSDFHGRISRNDPLHSVALTTTSVSIIPNQINMLRISCIKFNLNLGSNESELFDAQDILDVGNSVVLNNFDILPSATRTFYIKHFNGSANTFDVAYEGVPIVTIQPLPNANIGTSKMFLYLPNHGFNQIQNYTGKQDEKSFTITEIGETGGNSSKIYIKYSPSYRFRKDDVITITSSNATFTNSDGTISTFVGEKNVFECVQDINTEEFNEIRIDGNIDGAGTQGTLTFKENYFEVTTVLDHKLENLDPVRIMETGEELLDNNTQRFDFKRHKEIELIPSTNGNGYSTTAFKIFTKTIDVSKKTGSSGIIGMSNGFTLYNSEPLGGIPSTSINDNPLTVEKVFSTNNNIFLFNVGSVFSSSAIKGGGSNVFISSLYHGFSEIQDNTENGVLYKSISLEGEQYVFLTCPTLGTVISTGSVNDIFARISLTDSPGSVIFDAYLSNPKLFEEGSMPTLSELEFSVKLFNGALYDFNDMDYSFTLEITELVDYISNTNISSRRGVVEHVA